MNELSSKMWRRVLAVRPIGRGFGFAVLEGRDNLLDWGVKEPKFPDVSHSISQIRSLTDRYMPELLIIEDVRTSQRRSPKAHDLTAQAALFAVKEKLSFRAVKRRSAKQAIFGDLKVTQFELAKEIARRFPQLASRLPPPRKAWDSQITRLAMFEAVALALTAFSSKGD